MNRNLRLIIFVLTISSTTLACKPPLIILSTTANPTGLGVTRESIQIPFKKLGFTFDAPKTSDGQLRVQSLKINPMMSLELTGEAGNLSQISFMAGMTTENAIKTSLVYMALLIKIVLPDWSDDKAWLLDNMKELIDALKKGEKIPDRSIVINNRKVSLSMLDTGAGIMAVLVIKSP